MTLAQHSSESNEHYTPAYIVEAARTVLGGHIELDPASCADAQQIVQALWFFDRNGLTLDWWADKDTPSRVLLNPPGGKLDPDTLQPFKAGNGKSAAAGLSSAAVWWAKLVNEWQAGRVACAIFVCFSLSVFRTAQDSRIGCACFPLEFPFCVPRDRVNYDHVVDGVRVPTKGAPADSAIVFVPPIDELRDTGQWIGERTSAFAAVFSQFGAVRL